MTVPGGEHGGTGSGIGAAIRDVLFREPPVGLYIFGTDLRLLGSDGVLGAPAGAATRTAESAPPGGGAGRGGETAGSGTGAAPGAAGPGAEEAHLAGAVRTLRHVLDTGEPVFGLEQRALTAGGGRPDRTVSISAFRLRHEDGRPRGVAAAITDVTDRSRTRLGLLHEAGLRIGTTLDVARTAQELAEVAVPRLADTVAVDVLDCVLRGEAPGPGRVSVTMPFRRVGYVSSAGEGSRGAYGLGEISGFPFPSPFTQAMADLRPRLLSPLERDSQWLSHDPAREKRILSAEAHSLMVVPLSVRGVLLGLAAFYRWKRPDPLDEDDLGIAVQLADRTALSIDSARRYTREHTAALVLQRSLLPQRLPATTAADTAHSYTPAGTGGDWFDVIPLSGARVALVAGDVVGRGLHAATTMGRLRAAVHTLADMDLEPAELLARLDHLVARMVEDQPAPVDEYPLSDQLTGATCVYAVYDPVTGRCAMARAGHPPPVLARPDGGTEIVSSAPGVPLGLGGYPFETVERALPEGTLLGLYTNGLTTARRQDPDAALEKLLHVLARPGRSLRETCDAAVYALLPEPPEDDAVLLLARTRVLSAESVGSWTLPPDPEIVSTARTLASRQLVAWGLQDLDFTTELVVSELVTNAIRHGEGPVGLRLIRDSALICEVSDESSTAPNLHLAGTGEERGRGLFLVAQLTRRWGTRYTPAGKVIWAEQPLPEYEAGGAGGAAPGDGLSPAGGPAQPT